MFHSASSATSGISPLEDSTKTWGDENTDSVMPSSISSLADKMSQFYSAHSVAVLRNKFFPALLPNPNIVSEVSIFGWWGGLQQDSRPKVVRRRDARQCKRGCSIRFEPRGVVWVAAKICVQESDEGVPPLRNRALRFLSCRIRSDQKRYL